MKCGNCGHVNPEESIFCEKCLNLLVSPKYVMPVVELCISAAQGAARKALSIEDFLSEMKRVREHLKNFQARAAESEKTEVPLDIVNYTREKLSEGYRLFGGGLDTLERYASEQVTAHLVQGLEQLFNASLTLFEVDFMAELAQKVIPPPVACLKCGHLNPHRSRFCGQCNAVLPTRVGEDESSSFAYTESSPLSGDIRGLQSDYFLKLQEAAAGVAEGKISAGEFRETLDWMLGLVQKGIEQFKRVQFPSGELEPEIEKVKNWMENGLNLYLSGLHEMERFVADNDRQHLSRGLSQAQEGSNQLLKVVIMDQEIKQKK